jgi:hypothetical protein
MKRILLYLSILLSQILVSPSLYSQITYETTYTGAGMKLYMVNLEISGMKYLVKTEDSGNRYLKFYNLDHSLWKTIDCNPFPAMELCGDPGYILYNFDALYISENLFACDDKIEFLYSSAGDCRWFTAVYNELGTPLLIADSAIAWVKPNTPQQWRPIYNTPDGTKLILSYYNGNAKVFDLPCTLSEGIDQLKMNSTSDQTEMNVFPNPGKYQNTVAYKLPSGVDQAELIISDLSGKEIRRYKVDNNFTNLLITQGEIAPGTYFYSLVTESKVLVSKKVIILK